MGRARYLVVTAVVTALVGCGGDDEAAPDTAQVESDLTRLVQKQTGTRDVRVTCPGDVAEGDLCDVSAPGGLQAQVKVTRLENGEVDGEVVQP